MDGGSLDGIHLEGGRILFTGAKFISGELSIRQASLASGSVDFSAAELDGGSVSFDGAKFRGAEVSFERATVNSGIIGFVGSSFLDGRVEFKDCLLDGGTIDLTKATFAVNLQRETRSLLSFEGSELRAGTLLLHEINRDEPAEQHGSSESGPSYLKSISFYTAKLLGTTLDFRSARLWRGQRISFQSVVLDGTDIDFESIWFLGGFISFRNANLKNGTLRFKYSKTPETSKDQRHLPPWIAEIAQLAPHEPAKVLFMNLHVPEGLVDFWDTNLDGARIDFSSAMLGTGAIHFHGCHLRSGEILFDNADLFGTVVNVWLAHAAEVTTLSAGGARAGGPPPARLPGR
jgi:uncharacterized protein YjbI with pentapeptide repeats